MVAQQGAPAEREKTAVTEVADLGHHGELVPDFLQGVFSFQDGLLVDGSGPGAQWSLSWLYTQGRGCRVCDGSYSGSITTHSLPQSRPWAVPGWSAGSPLEPVTPGPSSASASHLPFVP